jgi:glycosyltransferase involved in cell wall biosynthesis
MKRPLLLFVANDVGYFISHRLPLAEAARAAGWDVAVACTGDGALLVARGFAHHPVPVARGTAGLPGELRALAALARLFRRLRPTLVHLVTLKPVLYGGIAARLTGVPAVVSAVAGLGFLFTGGGGPRAAAIRAVVVPLFRVAFGHRNQRIIFQNRADLEQLLGATDFDDRKAIVIRGSGVDLGSYPSLPEPDGPPVVAMASRLLRDKGVGEFVAAARLLRARGVAARFWLIGAPDPANPATFSAAQVEAWQAEGIVECLGQRGDVAALYARAHVIALPSYREGLPKALVEAAASGRAVVTTDVPGCRDAVEPGVTGLLVPPRDAPALAAAIEQLLADGAQRQRMGRAGRALAEREFRIERIVAAHLDVYHGLAPPVMAAPDGG